MDAARELFSFRLFVLIFSVHFFKDITLIKVWNHFDASGFGCLL